MSELNTVKVIGIAGVSRCGKDTFVNISSDILTQNGYYPLRVSFADQLKIEVSEMLTYFGFGASVYTNNNIDKSIIRPILVWWGCQRRKESFDERYWINYADVTIRNYISSMNHIDKNKLVFIISDCRFLNEAEWVKNEWDGIVIHLRKYITTTSYDGPDKDQVIRVYSVPPNEEEMINDPIVQNESHLKIDWEHVNYDGDIIKNPELRKIVIDNLNSLSFFNGTLC